MIWLLIGLISALTIGFLLSTVLIPRSSSRLFDVLLKGFLSIGFGFGTVSLVTWVFLFSTRNWYWIYSAELLLLICLGFLYKHKNYSESCNLSPELSVEAFSVFRLNRILGFILSILVVLSLVNSFLLYVQFPHGHWDAWAIWNLRARLLFHGIGYWEDFSVAAKAFQHFDYPLLIPLSVARLWHLIGHTTPVAPIVIAGLFTIATCGLLVQAIWLIKGPTNALLGGIALLGTRYFIHIGAGQYSDIALSFFYLAAIALFLLHNSDFRNSNGLLVASGFSAGLAVWTKNEGWLFLAAFGVVAFAAICSSGNLKAYLKKTKFFFWGIAPALAVAFAYKLSYAPPNDLIAVDRSGAMLSYLLDVSRYSVIAKEFATRLLTFHRWGYAAAALIIYAVLIGFRMDSSRKNGICFAAAIITLTVCGYFLVYVITPHDLVWHINTSLDRLYLQLWPSCLLVYFIAAAPPFETKDALSNQSKLYS